MPPRGCYLINDPQDKVPFPDALFDDADLDGVSARSPWGILAPREGKFVWHHFDQEIASAKRHNKKVMLRAYIGFRGKWMADWVYAKGAAPFDFAESAGFTQDVGTKCRVPVPWDPVFLQEWTRLIRTMGRRYASDPVISLVHMAGPDYVGGEMHLPKTPKDIAHWREIGYTKPKLVGAWQRIIDAYAESFPDKYLALNVSMPILKDGTAQEIIAYAENRLGKRFCIQHNGLAVKTTTNVFQHQRVQENRERAMVGFQQLCPWTPRGQFNQNGARFGGSFRESLEYGMQAGMTYLEIYQADMENKELRPIIHEYVRRMRQGT